MTAPEPLTTLNFPWTTPRNRLERLLANFVNVRRGRSTRDYKRNRAARAKSAYRRRTRDLQAEFCRRAAAVSMGGGRSAREIYHYSDRCSEF
jgi:hypothetical protein